jgi:hypothetical protein
MNYHELRRDGRWLGWRMQLVDITTVVIPLNITIRTGDSTEGIGQPSESNLISDGGL